MLIKSLITTGILLFALANGQDPQERRPVPSVPMTENCTASPVLARG
jgi:hypothetical protein